MINFFMIFFIFDWINSIVRFGGQSVVKFGIFVEIISIV